ncbi:MAG TPA: carbohydrate kinase family protein, partial [Hyphomicrobiaceae bacterium]|nr:carbohydrate kinase family protein [Hyphomicrobiaceae bacterium]
MLDDLKVLTVGSAMVDTIALVDSRHIERMSMKNADESFLLLAEGSKTDALEISTHTGGGAINAAVGLARQGADVATLAVLGRDQRGETILTRLISEGVSTRWVVRDDCATTGASVMVSSHDRNAAIFTYRGANGCLTPAHLRPDAFGVDLLYVASLSNRSADCFPAILELGRRNKAFVATNPGKRQLSARGDTLRANLKNIDMLSINRTEADTLVPLLVADRGDGGPPSPDDG